MTDRVQREGALGAAAHPPTLVPYPLNYIQLALSAIITEHHVPGTLKDLQLSQKAYSHWNGG